MKNLKPYAKAIVTTDPRYYAKAIGAAVIAGVGGIALGYADDVLSKGELWGAISLALVAGGGVFGVPNRDPDAEHQDDVQPPERPSLFDE